MDRTILIISIILLILGIIGASIYIKQNTDCESIKGQIETLFISNAQENCSQVKFLLHLSYGILIVGAILLIIGLTKDSKS